MLRTSFSPSSALFDRETTPKVYAKDSVRVGRPGSGTKAPASTTGSIGSSSTNGCLSAGGADSAVQSNRRTPPRSLTKAVNQEQPVQQLRELRLPLPAKWRLGQDHLDRTQANETNGTTMQDLRGSWVSVREHDATSPTNELDIMTDNQPKQDKTKDDGQQAQQWSVGTRMSVAQYRHLDQTVNTRLLSDETPPDEMDASWGLDALNDDAETDQQKEGNDHAMQTQDTARIETTPQLSAAHRDRHNPHTATPGMHYPNTDNNDTAAHGYGNMNYNEQPDTPTATGRGISAASITLAVSQPQAQHSDYDPSLDDQHSSSSSFASAHLKRVTTPPPPHHQPSSNASKFPWRDSKLDNIFMDLLAKESSAQSSRQSSPGPTSRIPQQRVPSPINPGYSETSASLSFGEIMDALNNVEDSLEHRASPAVAPKETDAAQLTRQRKFAKARERLAQLSPPVQGLQHSRVTTPQPEKQASGTRLTTITPHENAQKEEEEQEGEDADEEDNRGYENLEKQRQLAIKAAMAMDPSDDRSVPPASLAKSHREEILAKRKLALRRLACKTDVGRPSFGSRQTSQETDRVSTTSRDSQYRESISGSTLGPISAGPMENHLAKAETAAQEILALKVDALFQDPSRHIEARRSSILPLLLGQKTAETTPSKATVETTDEHQPLIFAQNRRTSSDPQKAKQYDALATRRLEKQTSSFVEQLANGTDSAIRSTSIDASYKSSSVSPTVENNDHHDDEDSEDEELRLSTGMEDAFKCLGDLDLDLSMDVQHQMTKREKRRQSADVKSDTLLSGVMLPHKPKRKGEYSLRWEAQLEDEDEEDKGLSTARRGQKRSSLPLDDAAAAHIGNISSATLMPEDASFSHAEGHLRRYVTSQYPFDDWNQLKILDLTRREVESLINLSHLVPNLETLNISENQITYLTGVPVSVRTLLAKSNQLSDLTNFAHLVNLQYLDISNNGVEDLTGLSSLGHLRELIAVSNRIRSVAPLQEMDGLIRLDMSRNCLQRLDFKWSKLKRLEYFNASHNQIEQLDNLESLTGLIHANLGHNSIEDISLVKPLKRLRILNLTQNRLVQFDAKPFPNLKTLYLDDNRLETLLNCADLTRLENFSVRDQEGDGTAIDMTEFLNSRKLYLSGNPVHSLDLSAGFYQLEYLEICAGCLYELPPDFASLMPNLRGLNLSYNGLDSLASLEGLHRLRRLVFVGNNLKRFNAVLALVKRLRSLVTLDLRHNPLTSNMYPVMSVRQGASPYQDTYRTSQMSTTEADWRRRDLAFRRSLPDSMYLKRSLYRASIMKACKRLEWFDGALIQDKERERIPYVLGEMLDRAGNFMMRRDDDEEEEDDEEDGVFGYDDHEDGGGGGDHDRQVMVAAAPEHAGELLPRIKPFVLADRRSILSGATTRSSNVTTSSQGRRDSRQSPDLRHHARWMTHAHGAGLRTPGGLAAPGGGNRGADSPCPRGDSTTLRPRPTSAAFQNGSSHSNNLSHHHHHHHKRTPSFAPLVVENRGPQASHQHRRKQRVEEEDEDDEEEEEEEEDDREERRHAAVSVKSDGSDRRSAVRNWRDEVNEMSQRRMMASTPQSATSASARAVISRQASHSQPSSGLASARSSRLPPPRTSSGPPPTTLTLAIHQKLSQAAASSSPRTSYQHHGRRRSDGIMHHSHNHNHQYASTPSGGRALTGTATAAATGSPRVEATRISPNTPRSMAQHVQLGRPNHLRRRSFGLYHPHGGHHSRRREMLGEVPGHLSSSSPMLMMASSTPQDYFMSMSVPAGGFESPATMGATAAVGSPSYFSLNPQASGHAGLQTPYGGMSRSLHSALGGHGSGRSLPNTPSRANAVANGRLSQQGYPFHTLARDMERNDV